MNRLDVISQKQVAELLSELNFSNDEVSVYEALLKYGSLTKLELSRRSGVNRTKVYRIVESLVKRGVVEDVIDAYSTTVSLTGVDVLRRMLKDQEQKIEQLKSGIPMLESLFANVQQLTDKQTKVVFYRGHDGIRQMAWNNLRAKGEIVGYTYRLYTEAIGEKLFNEWLNEVISRKITVREIITDTYSDLKKGSPQEDVMPKELCESRYVSKEILDYDHQLDIYNDVVAIYNWYEGEVFGVEIYNEKVAKLQKQLFEIVWKIAEPT